MEDIGDKPMVVQAGGRKIRCDYLVIATDNPLMGKKGVVAATLFQSKLSLLTSYVLGARVPKGTVPAALFWDTSEPYYYLRVDPHEDHDYVIFGGEDVKTGQEDGRQPCLSTARRAPPQRLAHGHDSASVDGPGRKDG